MNLGHKIARGVVTFAVLYIVLSLEIGKDADDNVSKYALPALIAGVTVYVAVFLVDLVFKKSEK